MHSSPFLSRGRKVAFVDTADTVTRIADRRHRVGWRLCLNAQGKSSSMRLIGARVSVRTSRRTLPIDAVIFAVPIKLTCAACWPPASEPENKYFLRPSNSAQRRSAGVIVDLSRPS